MVSILVEVIHRPITSLLALALISIFALIHHLRLDYPSVGLSYTNVIQNKEFWRLGTSQLSHVDLLHVLFNVSALWSLGAIEEAAGTKYFLKISALLFLLSPILVLATYHILIVYFDKEQYKGTTAVGYSCVLFGFMSVCTVRQPGGISILPIFGLTVLPTFLVPFSYLAVTQLLVPRASFVGHLAGIVAGYIISIPAFDYIPFVVVGGVFVVAIALMVGNYVSQLESGGAREAVVGFWTDLKLPFLSSRQGGGGDINDGGDTDEETGRLLGRG